MPAFDLHKWEKHAREYRITFLEELSPPTWPDRHRATFEQVQRVAETKFDTYTIDPNTAENEPWRVEVKSMAKTLVEKARRCSQRNESNWRFACEPMILGRLSAEVCWYVLPTLFTEAISYVVQVKSAENGSGAPR